MDLLKTANGNSASSTQLRRGATVRGKISSSDSGQCRIDGADLSMSYGADSLDEFPLLSGGEHHIQKYCFGCSYFMNCLAPRTMR